MELTKLFVSLSLSSNEFQSQLIAASKKADKAGKQFGENLGKRISDGIKERLRNVKTIYRSFLTDPLRAIRITGRFLAAKIGEGITSAIERHVKPVGLLFNTYILVPLRITLNKAITIAETKARAIYQAIITRLRPLAVLFNKHILLPLQKVAGRITGIATRIGNNILAGITTVLRPISAAYNRFIVTPLTRLRTAVYTRATRIATAIKTGITAGLLTLKSLYTVHILVPLQALFAPVAALGRRLGLGIVTGFSFGLAAIRGVFTASILPLITKGGAIALRIGSAISKGIITPLTSIGGKLVKLIISGLGRAARGAAAAAGKAGKKIGKWILAGIRKGMKGIRFAINKAILPAGQKAYATALLIGKKIGGFILKGVRTAMLGLGALLLGIIGGGIKAINLAAAAEQTETAFKTILGSAEAAKDMMATLFDFTATTPFQFDQVADAAKKLLAFGSTAEDIPRELKAIGDVASGINAPIGEIAEIYGKARVQGRLFGEDINQLTGRGIPIIQELAKQFGVTDSEVKKLVENGEVNFGHLEEAFRSLTGEGGKFSGLMAAQSETLAGKWSTFKDTLIITLTKIGTVLADKLNLTERLAGAIEFFTKVGEGFDIFLRLIEGGVDPLNAFQFAIRSAFGDETAEKIQPIIDLIRKVREVLTAFRDEGFDAGIQAIFEQFQIPEETRVLILDFFDKMQLAWLWIIENKEPIIAALTGMAVAFGALTIIGSIVALVSALANPIVWIIALVGLLSAAWNQNWGGIQEKTAAVWEFLQPIFQNIGIWITETLIPNMQMLYEQWVTVWWPAIQTAVSDFWEAAKPILEELRVFFAETLPEAWEAFSTKAKEVWDAIEEATKTAWDAIKKVLEEIKTFFTETIPTALDTLKTKWNSAMDSIKSTANGVVDSINNIIGAVNNMISKFNEVTGFSVPSFGGIPGFAGGVTNFSGGLALVGERGAEIVNLPRGSDVIPNHVLARLGQQSTVRNIVNRFNTNIANTSNSTVVDRRSTSKSSTVFQPNSVNVVIKADDIEKDSDHFVGFLNKTLGLGGN